MASARVRGLDHVNIAGPMELLERCLAFYTVVLGLRAGPRAESKKRGFWLYAGEAAIVHLTESANAPAAGAGALNHVAFACREVEAAERALQEHGIAFTRQVHASGAVQLFLQDPAGVRLELSFSE